MHSIEDVVENGHCIGCGGCSVATGGAIPIKLSPLGAYQADLNNAKRTDLEKGTQVCPFSDGSKDETRIAEEVFPELEHHDNIIGKYSTLYAGRVADDQYVVDSSSGGLTSWVAQKLLETKQVDGIIHVAQSNDSTERLFSYQISESLQSFSSSRKSNYYASTFDEALTHIEGNGKQYAFVGVPCYVRAARLACEQRPALLEQVTYFLGLVCGHMKTSGFAESLSWQLGVPPMEIEAVDFRVKVPNQPSNNYNFAATAANDGRSAQGRTNGLLGGNWGHGMFQLNACNFCDDIFAETADIGFGDAWLPQYKSDWRGTNIVVVRNATIQRILDSGVNSNEIQLDEISPTEAAASQSGNVRHRRIGLAVRLQDDLRAGKMVPRKRVKPGYKGVSRKRIRLVRQRRLISTVSHTAFSEAKRKNDFEYFVSTITPLIDQYQRIEKGNLVSRFIRKIQRALKR